MSKICDETFWVSRHLTESLFDNFIYIQNRQGAHQLSSSYKNIFPSFMLLIYIFPNRKYLNRSCTLFRELLSNKTSGSYTEQMLVLLLSHKLVWLLLLVLFMQESKKVVRCQSHYWYSGQTFSLKSTISVHSVDAHSSMRGRLDTCSSWN